RWIGLANLKSERSAHGPASVGHFAILGFHARIQSDGGCLTRLQFRFYQALEPAFAGFLFLDVSRDYDSERGALAELALHADRAADLLEMFFHDAQAQADAAPGVFRRGFVHLHKRLEDIRQMLLRDSHAGIADLDGGDVRG